VAEGSGGILATRIALLELGEERRLVQEGYELLDEKRMLLASEILRRLRQYSNLAEHAARREAEARERLLAAVRRHGWQDLALAPVASLDDTVLGREARVFLGLELATATLEGGDSRLGAEPVVPTPELRACAQAVLELVRVRVALAAEGASLRRLAQEYRRTERRARALENVVLPEIDEALRFVGEQLEALDLEEALRVRSAVHARERR
jgi:V/A-type H+-transporting ATPase subunit D